MGAPKYVPSTLCQEPAIFGRRRATWIGYAPDDYPAAARLSAARVQHEVAREVRGTLERDKLTQEAFAASISWTPVRLSRALNGAAPVALEDLLLLICASRSTLGAVATAADLGSDAVTENLEHLLTYLERQQQQVRARIAGIAQAHPST